MNYLPLLICALLTACNNRYLSVHTDYLSHENLASYHVNTPDPRLENPPIGQRLTISWSLPKTFLALDNLHLMVTLRFRNREQSVQKLAISKTHGYYVFEQLNADYFSKRGILTYTIDLIGNGEVIEQWRHHIWTDLIQISPNSCEESIIPSAEDEEDF